MCNGGVKVCKGFVIGCNSGAIRRSGFVSGWNRGVWVQKGYNQVKRGCNMVVTEL